MYKAFLIKYGEIGVKGKNRYLFEDALVRQIRFALNKIDGDYFNIIIADSQDVTIQSRNTGHYWYLHCAGYPTEEALVIFHKHRFKDGYHQHGHARSLRQAIKSIVRHDDYQLNVRKCV